MKPRNLKIAISRCAIAACMLLAGGSAIAAVANTPHNLGSTSTAGQTNSYSGTAAICVFCHTPHGADTSASVPLWNKTLEAAPATAYATYDSLGTTSMDGATADVGSVSIACLSCHDGTQAMDSVINAPGPGLTNTAYTNGAWTPNAGSILSTGELDPLNVANLSQDLTDDHPIGIQYGGGNITTALPTATTRDTDFTAPQNGSANGTTVWWIDTAVGTGAVREKTDIQLYTRVGAVTAGVTEPFVECASCHDPHSENTTFLRVPNDGSAVCLACHTK